MSDTEIVYAPGSDKPASSTFVIQCKVCKTRHLCDSLGLVWKSDWVCSKTCASMDQQSERSDE